MFKPAREMVEQTPRAPRVAHRVGLSHRAAARGTQPLGQRIGDVALLVLAATLNQRVRSEDLDCRLVQSFGPIDDD